MNCVVDASVAAKWFFEEVHSDEAILLLNIGNELHTPDLILIEFDSILCKRIRREEISEEEGEVVRDAIRSVPIQSHPSGDLLDAAFYLANRTKRSIYDCIYLTLAMLLDGRMVTADRRFYDGAQGGLAKKYLLWVGDLV